MPLAPRVRDRDQTVDLTESERMDHGWIMIGSEHTETQAAVKCARENALCVLEGRTAPSPSVADCPKPELVEMTDAATGEFQVMPRLTRPPLCSENGDRAGVPAADTAFNCGCGNVEIGGVANAFGGIELLGVIVRPPRFAKPCKTVP